MCLYLIQHLCPALNWAIYTSQSEPQKSLESALLCHMNKLLLTGQRMGLDKPGNKENCSELFNMALANPDLKYLSSRNPTLWDQLLHILKCCSNLTHPGEWYTVSRVLELWHCVVA